MLLVSSYMILTYYLMYIYVIYKSFLYQNTECFGISFLYQYTFADHMAWSFLWLVYPSVQAENLRIPNL